eukprot:TRINITY_DN24889_c0_g1_i1.p1 TRINITY_DN24889_c0_g1~~TRINITY_DN24889_c0_g1_i1.p1  ORF type:complete len:758 (+),score=105.76 TRINITY_DN24889_c0_g1_i1:70-2343(+)
MNFFSASIFAFFSSVFLVKEVNSQVATTEHPEDLVELLAGTDTHDGGSNSNGNVLPQVKRQYGFNDWAPQTNNNKNSWWFRRTDTEFFGVRCTHQPSPWIGDYGHFLVQPHITESPGALTFSPGEATFRPYLFKADIDRIKLEFSASSHASLLRVTFPAGTSGHVSLMIGSGSIQSKKGVITGFTTEASGGVPADWRGMFFVMKTVSPTSGLAISGDNLLASKTATLSFAPNNGSVVLALATSFISQEQAEMNLQQEVGSLGFDELVEQSRAHWNAALRHVEITAIDDMQHKIFYTNLWKSMLFPRFLQEVNSEGEEVHFSPYKNDVLPGKLVTDSGFWDAYRTVYTLKSVLNPMMLGALVDGWVNAFEEAGWLPQWPSPGQRSSMVGSMGDVVLADAIAKSTWGLVTGFNITKAYEAIWKDAFVEGEGLYGRVGLGQYKDVGFVAESEFRSLFESSQLSLQQGTSGFPESVTRTQNYYIADAAIARAADLLGRYDDRDVLWRRSRRYGVLFNNETLFFQPKDAFGHFYKPFDPLEWKNGFTESGGWQYRFYIPHDVDGLKDLYRGSLCHNIEALLKRTEGPAFHVGGYGTVIHEMSELEAIQADFGLYAHNNQPVHHILWVAKKAGCDILADEYLRKVMRKLYTTHGWSGDEDNGEMSSWYVLSALGIYSLEGAKDEMVLGSPAVVRATVRLLGGRTLHVETENQAEENVHVQRITWAPQGGSPRVIETNVIRYTELMQGGTLSFTLGNANANLMI